MCSTSTSCVVCRDATAVTARLVVKPPEPGARPRLRAYRSARSQAASRRRTGGRAAGARWLAQHRRSALGWSGRRQVGRLPGARPGGPAVPGGPARAPIAAAGAMPARCSATTSSAIRRARCPPRVRAGVHRARRPRPRAAPSSACVQLRCAPRTPGTWWRVGEAGEVLHVDSVGTSATPLGHLTDQCRSARAVLDAVDAGPDQRAARRCRTRARCPGAGRVRRRDR